jgi:hypothetical protein
MEQQRQADGLRDLDNEVESLPALLRGLTALWYRVTLGRVNSDKQQLNETETEQDEIRSEAIRRLKVRQLSKGRPTRRPALSSSPADNATRSVSTAAQ